MQVEQRHRVDMLRKLAHVDDSVVWSSLTAYQTLEAQKKNYNIVIYWLFPSLVMLMSNLEKSS